MAFTIYLTGTHRTVHLRSSKTLVRFAVHRKFKRTSPHNVVIGNERLTVGSPIKFGTLDIDIFVAVVLRNDPEDFPVLELYACLLEKGTAENIHSIRRINLIEA